ncbi:MAG TPA: ATP-dependent zinc metalloprotease FtsH [Fimbriimonadales bacterium]|nr:ATP-dependent zinc metalloprotease FtsH [Fimbriimonadales bacterium]
MLNNRIRALVFVLIVLFGLIWLLSSTGTNTILQSRTSRIELTQLLKDAEAKLVSSVKWQGDTITAEYTDGTTKIASAVPLDSQTGGQIFNDLKQSGVQITPTRPLISEGVMNWIFMLLAPLALFALLWFMLIRQAQAGSNQALMFGRSRARRVNENIPKVTFEDVAGVDEAKAELAEIVDFLKNTKKYIALGAKIPKGVLLTGPPGCGKTHLARAIAGEAGVPFFHISGSDFVEMFVGVGAARVRDLFETAKAHRPSLIFVDEIDAVGRQRGAGLGGGHDEREQTLNQLLVEMDGFDPNQGVIVIAATNRPDVLDPALLRPGRFDRHVVVDAPDAKGREAILKIHARGKPLADDVDLSVIAKRTVGFTGADLANALNEAALLAARNNRTQITMEELNEALERVIAGPQRKSRVVSRKEREVIAVHEAGHAIVGELLEHTDPVHKVTILPRGHTLGSTWQLPEDDKYLVTKAELLDDITSLLGGRVAEEMVFGEVTTGASNDLERVTHIARAMVCQYGMSDKFGALALGRRHENPFIGRDYLDDRDYSEEVAKIIDEEVRNIVDNCYMRAKEIITENRRKLDKLVKALLEKETLEREEFLAIMNEEVEAAPDTPANPPTQELESEKPEAKPTQEAKKKGEGIIPPKLKPGTAESG